MKKIAVVLSGSIRFHHKSVESVKMLRSRGDQVDVYIHTWSGISNFVGDSWSWHFPPSEPTEEILSLYNPFKVVIESWPEARRIIVEQVEYWKQWNPLKFFTHYGMPGMWRSLQGSYDLITDPLDYDTVIRLRFDGAMLGGYPDGAVGWNIPDAVDFNGICDQLAWYNRAGTNDKRNLEAYFRTYSWMGQWFETGTPFSPEMLLKKSLDSHLDHTPNRPSYRYTIHND